MGEFGWTYPVPDDFDHHYPDASKWLYDDRVLVTLDVGTMVRTAMPAVLDTGQPVTLGVWVAVYDEDRWVYSRFEGDWGGFTFRGVLVNAPEPWPEVFGAPVVVEATTGPALARVISSEHEVLQRVLTGENRVRLPGSGQ
ncbi:hypothetical protein [Lentzea sp. NPDC051838]|uniref:hypothetical protein n=1 Tax=Lentzea sp. NPDC051838 TaxID=3154849 RepID=UPI00343A6F96